MAALMLSVPFAVLASEDPATGASAAAWDGTIATAYKEGAGTEADPYTISTPAELAYMAQQINGTFDSTGKYFVLTADIDMGGKQWTPIGNGVRKAISPNEFKGTFDGNGHTISNLKADVTTGQETSWEVTVGLFGILNGATVKNLELKNFDIDGRNNSGALAGFVTGMTHIVSVTVTGGTVDGYSGVGGVVGRMYGGQIWGCSSSATVTGTVPVSADGNGDKDIYTHVGGIVGISSTGPVNSAILFCENTGNVTGSSKCPRADRINAGGIVGAAFSGNVEFCVNSGTVAFGSSVPSAVTKNVGGIIGESTIAAYGCYDGRETTAADLIGKGTSQYSFFNGPGTGSADCTEMAAADLKDSKAIIFTKTNNATAISVFGAGTINGAEATVMIFEDMYADKAFAPDKPTSIDCGGTELLVYGFGNNTESLNITGTGNVSVMNCKFIGNSSSAEKSINAVIVHGASGVRVLDNDISAFQTKPELSQSRGIYLTGCYGTISIEHNRISGTTFNAIQVTEVSQAARISISNNIISDWDSDEDTNPDGMGRAIRVNTSGGTGDEVKVIGNTFSKEYKDITSKHDWANIMKLTSAGTGTDAYTIEDNVFGSKQASLSELKESEGSKASVYIDHNYTLCENLSVKADEWYGISGNYVITGSTLTNAGTMTGNGTVVGNVTGTGTGTGHAAMKGYLLDFTTTPAGANVVLSQNSKAIDAYNGSQFAVKAGTYAYTVSAAGYNPHTGTVIIASADQNVPVLLSAITTPDKSQDTTTNPDGSTTIKETEKVTNPDGSQTETVTQTEKDKDGKVTGVKQTVSIKDDKTGVTTEAVNTTDASGRTVSESKTTMEVEQKSSDGNATASVSDESMKKAIEQIKAARESSGPESTSVITIDAKSSDPSKETRSVNVDMSADSLAALLEADAELEVSTDVGKLTFDQDVLKNLSTKPGESVSMSISDIEKSTLTEEQRSKAGDNPVFSLSAAIGGNKVHDLGGLATITLPYVLKEGQDPENVKVYYLDDEGGMKEYICSYDPATKTVSFVTDHFSYFVLAYGVPEENGGNTLMYAAVAVIAIIIAALAVGMYMRRRNDGTA